MRWAIAALVILLGGSTAAPAADLTQVYDRAVLEYWGQRYTRSTTRILNELLWPVLLRTEREALGGKPVLEFPLWGEGERAQHPLGFYVPDDSRSIVLPIFSLKFLDDLCTAYAWLQINGYSLETVSEYTAILKYGSPPPGGFPPPLPALQIPEDALNDPKVDELALAHFTTARTFILLHEMGHIRYGHAARTYAESVRNEQQADEFAATVMQRTPLPPLGILVFFMADAHWSGYPASSNDTHPVTGQRIHTLADHLDDPALAQQFHELAKLIDDPDIRAGFAATGKAGALADLAPRRRGELPRRQVRSEEANQGTLFDGYYRGELVQFLEPAPMAVELFLQREGKHVLGNYSFGLGIGKIEGDVVGEKLRFEWEWSGNYGQGILEARGDGSFSGTWGYRESTSGAGTWTGSPSP